VSETEATQILEELAESNSKLACRCQDDPDFYRTTVKMVERLAEFYGQMDDGGRALQSFERKLRRWVRTSTDASYIGFWGELHVACWLSQHRISHHFVDETQKFQTPDLELKVLDRKVYLEVKTLQENLYEWFASRLLEEMGSFLPNRGIGVEGLRLMEGKEEALVAKAVQVIREDWLEGPAFPIKYEGEEGEFSIVLSIGGGWICSWPEVRVRKDGTPWLESQLEATLRKSIGQFRLGAPTFLVWVSFDKLLPDIDTHVFRILKQCGTDFVDVAGVIIFDEFLKWGLIRNPSYREYEELEQEGLFEAIGAFRDR
jgi:hypothetical protein